MGTPAKVKRQLTRPAASLDDTWPGVQRCRRKFLRIFPSGFADPRYLAWERDYKWRAHEQWRTELSRQRMREFLIAGRATDAAAAAIRIESRTNLLFSFEKMAVRDAVKTAAGARLFTEGLYDLLHSGGTMSQRFERWKERVGQLPRHQSRVLAWPVLTVFGFLAQPKVHMFLKPTVTRIAAAKFGFDLAYGAPSQYVYNQVLSFAAAVREALHDLEPRDMIDIQSFIWVQGSDEY